MYRKIVWCYVFVLTLLDISLNTKLTAQGKSHGVTVHDSLIEGITFQEWGKESGAEGGGAGAGRGGRAVAAGALQLSPPALDFGRAALATAHALTVTLTNTANTTMHLASVAGTTPDFHASFFESKTLAPQSNTSFSVVYLGRREGLVAAHLYIHTSLGVHKYPVSAVGVASEWGVWPLLGLRVPLNATVEPLLTLYNPTDSAVQVSEVYSSAAWLGLELPGGAAHAPRAAWTVAPHSQRALVRLRVAPSAGAGPLTAYVRVRGAGLPGGALLLCVQARAAPPGEYASPLQLRLRPRGSRDALDVLELQAANSAPAAVRLQAALWAPRCASQPIDPPPPPDPPAAAASPAPPAANGQSDKGTANGNGAKSPGVQLSLLQPQLEPHQALTPVAQLTLDYAALWAEHAAGGAAGGEGAWCAGWVRLGRAAVPYSVRLLPGTLRRAPHQLHFVTANREDALRQREVRVRNEFPVGVHVTRLELAPSAARYWELESLAPLELAPGADALLARVRLRAAALAPGAPESLAERLQLASNVTDYELPLLLYSGRLRLEWEWPNSEDGSLRLGAVGTSSTRRVALRLHNPAPAALCLEPALQLAGASLALDACAGTRAPPGHACRCLAPGAAARATLSVVAPAREGAARRAAAVGGGAGRGAARALTRAALELSAHEGRVAALPLAVLRAAPYAPARAVLQLDVSMALRMRVLAVSLPPREALQWVGRQPAPELGAGRHAVGEVVYAPETLCAPHCYTGLDVTSDEGAAWLQRADEIAEADDGPDDADPCGAALRADAALLAARRALFAGAAPRNVTLHVHTSQAVQLPARATLAPHWPRLAPARAQAGLAAVGGALPFSLRLRNPSATHAVLLQPVLHGAALGADEAACADCVWARRAFSLQDWRGARALRGGAGARRGRRALPLLLLAAGAEMELRLSLAPGEAAALASYLYVRNNLTVLEPVLLTGRGAYPRFELAGRRPGSGAPLLFEVSSCGGTVRRTVLARNTGPVPLRLRDWRLAGQPCQARGFRLSPCAALALAPNESRPLTLAFSPDYTLARAAADLTARTDTARAAFLLQASAPARLLPRCAAAAPRPPWEPAARAAAALLALAALALVLAAAALDAERELRRARAQRPPPAPRAPLDLRALVHEPPPPAPRRPAPRRRRPPRRDAPDPRAERRAFERWRADVLGRPDDDDERSSEDADRDKAHVDTDPLLDTDKPEPHDRPRPGADGYEADPETEDRPQGSGGSGDDDAVSTGSGSASASSSSPTVDDRDEAEEGDEPETLPTHDRSTAAGDDSPPSGTPRAHSHPGGEGPAGAPSRVPALRVRVRAGSGSPAREARRGATARHPARKDKAAKRARSRPASPPRSPAPRPPAPAALRWGASWSSVVARAPAPAPLAPIGEHVRRREPEPRALAGGDHSLFYFNGDTPQALACHDSDFTWRPPPPLERPSFSPTHDFLGPVADEASSVGPVGPVGSGVGRSLSSVWGAGAALEPRRDGPAAAAWLWGGYGEPAVRPPPGFGAPPRPVRPYDPFRSLASIWAPGALDWRPDPEPPEPEQ
ncbi:LOW QUALITY PROTEIN: transmembrane protein 131 [Spodoptera frugiperda]|uniref:LOW QUALITY PROTEIN: transmembrane protein 131 n=3 Tax=Spodoptera frugiperda TaxID=7108 RepID=A0A9R0ELB0_SPOFR|nr:LOW QUALITY PROTEIN: transmembrane protein 131 [Spodoptera frugiperda]